MKWFRHDTAAHLDEKLIVLRKRHGWEAIGVYWLLVGLCFESEGEIAEYKLPIIFEANEVPHGADIFATMVELRLFTKAKDGFRSARVTKEIAVQEEYRKIRSDAGRAGGQASAERRRQAKSSTTVEQGSSKRQRSSTISTTRPDQTGPDQTVPDLTKQDGSAKKSLTDDKAGEKFRAILVENQWCDEHYAAKTWDQGCGLRGDDRTEFMRKVRLVLVSVKARPMLAKKVFHEIAGFVNDRGAMQSKLSPQEKKAREIFREETGQSLDEA